MSFIGRGVASLGPLGGGGYYFLAYLDHKGRAGGL